MLSPIIVLVGLLLWALAAIFRTGRRDRGLPPGPPTLPIIGNLHVFPNSAKIHLKFAEWASQYGDVFSLKAASQTMIVISGATAIRDIVDKTGWIASGRPHLYLANLYAGDKYLLWMSDSPELRAIRNTVAVFFSKQNAFKWRSVVSAESTQLLLEIMENPANLEVCVKRYIFSVIKTLSYGQRAPRYDAADVKKYFETFGEVSRIMSPGSYPPIDLIPVLKYLPEWLAPWHSATRAVKKERDMLHAKMRGSAEKRAVNGATHEVSRCFLDEVLQPDENTQLDRDLSSYTALVLLDGGSDVSAMFILTFILVLASDEELQARVWKELNSVVDNNRLPDYEDLKKMPVLQAVAKEIHRLRSPVPLGIPHSICEDVHYKGYVLPKGSTVMLNTYGMNHDPSVFENPELFDPERFLRSEFGVSSAEKEKDFRDSFMFGGGRRVCPGQWLARDEMDLAVMRLVWAFEYSSPIDAQTKQHIPCGLPPQAFNWEIVTTPKPFQCTVKTRHGVDRAVKDTFLSAMEELQKYEADLG
ncbi:cytochrome P450 [Hymenopellis radicata]|nr:cytochrome P450 [Hymenopellis radicata]